MLLSHGIMNISEAAESEPSQKVNVGGGSGNSSGSGTITPDLFSGCCNGRGSETDVKGVDLYD